MSDSGYQIRDQFKIPAVAGVPACNSKDCLKNEITETMMLQAGTPATAKQEPCVFNQLFDN
jgi:hypothetical protein